MTAERDTFFLESIRGILAIKNFGNEAGRTTRFSNHVADSVTAHARVGHFRVWSEFSTSAIFGMQNVLVILLAARTIIDDAMTVGMMIAFIAYKSHFTTRGAGLVDKFFQFRLARIHLGRLEDIVDAKTELEIAGRRSNEPVVARKLSGGIEVRDLWYRYGDNENYILSGIDFDIRPGEHVAITGPSGTGKTTLLKLLVGLSKPDRGSIRVDGIAAHGLAGFRDQVGIVMQNDFLLGGSLLDNVTFFAAEPDIAWAETLCRMAGIHDEISAMPMGYRTLVGDMGDVLSGGQKQRLLLARALYRKPKILFLDEATSHLDPLHERQLVERIAGLRITRVVIAHREETIRHADRVIDLGSLNRGA